MTASSTAERSGALPAAHECQPAADLLEQRKDDQEEISVCEKLPQRRDKEDEEEEELQQEVREKVSSSISIPDREKSPSPLPPSSHEDTARSCLDLVSTVTHVHHASLPASSSSHSEEEEEEKGTKKKKRNDDKNEKKEMTSAHSTETEDTLQRLSLSATTLRASAASPDLTIPIPIVKTEAKEEAPCLSLPSEKAPQDTCAPVPSSSSSSSSSEKNADSQNPQPIFRSSLDQEDATSYPLHCHDVVDHSINLDFFYLKRSLYAYLSELRDLLRNTSHSTLTPTATGGNPSQSSPSSSTSPSSSSTTPTAITSAKMTGSSPSPGDPSPSLASPSSSLLCRSLSSEKGGVERASASVADVSRTSSSSLASSSCSSSTTSSPRQQRGT
ncbi:hypothetical protein CSUI_005003, partial [Cystoisospora suis]